MKILQIISHYVPAYEFGGPLRVAHSLGKALIELSNEVHVCTTNLKNSRENLDVQLDQPKSVDGVAVYYEPTIFSRYWGFSPQLYARTKQEIEWADIIFVHFHYQFANWVGAFLARKARKPYVLFAHGSFNCWGIKNKSALKKQWYLRFLERHNIKQARFIAFNADEERTMSLFASQGRVIPSGVDPGEFAHLPPLGSWRKQHSALQDKICYLYLGRLNPNQKGLDLLIPAFARLVRKHPQTHLILAGPDERGGELIVRQLIAAFGIQDHVTLTGMIDGADKLALLQDCDVYVLASPSEGTSIALLEAMYMALPVIVTDRVGLSNRIQQQQCGLVVNRDENELVQALQTMLQHNLRLEMGRRAKNLIASEYTWDIITHKLIEEIQKVA